MPLRPGWATIAQSGGSVEGLGCNTNLWVREFEYLHTSHRRYFEGHSSNQLVRLHMHTRWGSLLGAPGTNKPCYNVMGPHMQTGCRKIAEVKESARTTNYNALLWWPKKLKQRKKDYVDNAILLTLALIIWFHIKMLHAMNHPRIKWLKKKNNTLDIKVISC